MGHDVQEVELLLDGDWRPVSEHLESLSDDDEPSTKNLPNGVPATSRMTAAASAPNFSQTHLSSKIEDDDVIVLSDSDDDVNPEAAVINIKVIKCRRVKKKGSFFENCFRFKYRRRCLIVQ